MRIAVVSDGDSLSSYVADDFGHAPYILVVDADTMEFTVTENGSAKAEGAGMRTAEKIIGLGPDAVITGGIGPHGYNMLADAGMTVSFDEDGTVEECVKNVKRRIMLMKG